ncbi:biopolymer transporter ExbD [Hymenobacter cellulosilyticus]|uniref:Biopolymer transporter ExbD n=1 Tax=Hymenobacter cellulosilyticus TaxID=2932248 RepID=A0A8T9Q5Z4_9BACT|nr:biopolymer transporter ExbD [Hymenobacter cellulosilyticus]UOQ72984.1 biopolymer transporter ExbD [Hymenobacter cellulosilyticus]
MTTPSSIRSSRRRNIRPLDLTPIVCVSLVLAVLLLLTSKAAKQTVLQLTMPSQNHKEYIQKFSAHDGLTLLLGRQRQIHYYRGGYYSGELPKLQTIHNGYSGLRRVLLEARYNNPRVVILIKPGPGAKYRDLVDALDEMNITDQKKYAVVDLHKLDYALLRQNGL